MSDLTSSILPKTAATITVRVVKSFEYRVEKSLVLHGVNLEQTTVGGLKDQVRSAIQTQPGWKPYRTTTFDTLKLYNKAHGSKTSNLIINLDHEEYIFKDNSAILANLGVENETEISFFNLELYNQFKLNPETKWE
ncbi:hypothetical protein M422DRAFT_61142 [Sphaerobolus stellatus SS14]|uniref:Uncharacterized protein n=1 Tax=Sphaerobolus stellatus (strain SS14) TaxID=990650 RepID=A0A0C9UEC2_SPHS4|nr:hypothetical protein M422DRAFT_62420 [Sphaerobolus stellatus SS14]KIJ36667.1 hypothetical protein M422DRAFT_61142 [Sphaerobolus stellatus SS14]